MSKSKSGQHHGRRVGLAPLDLSDAQEERRVFKMLRRAILRRVAAAGTKEYAAADARVSALANRLSVLRDRVPPKPR